MNHDLHRSVEDPDRFLFDENWESGEDLDAHLASPHLAAVANRIPELLGQSGPSIDRVRRIAWGTSSAARSPRRGPPVPAA